MANYDENNRFLGMTYEGRIFYPSLGYWKVVTYYTILADDYFTISK